MKRYKKRDEQRLKEKNHDTNRDDKSIKPSKEVWYYVKKKDS